MKKFLRRQVKQLITEIACRPLRSERGISLVVVIMLMVIILAITGAGLLFSSVDLRVSSNYRAGTQAFYAADNGANAAYAQIVSNPMNTTAIRVALPDGTVYCTGTINNTTNCTAGQEKNVGLVISPRAGDQLPGGSGVTPGLLDFQYNINAAGVRTNLGAAREVQVLAEWGPIPTAIK